MGCGDRGVVAVRGVIALLVPDAVVRGVVGVAVGDDDTMTSWDGDGGGGGGGGGVIGVVKLVCNLIITITTTAAAIVTTNQPTTNYDNPPSDYHHQLSHHHHHNYPPPPLAAPVITLAPVHLPSPIPPPPQPPTYNTTHWSPTIAIITPPLFLILIIKMLNPSPP